MERELHQVAFVCVNFNCDEEIIGLITRLDSDIKGSKSYEIAIYIIENSGKMSVDLAASFGRFCTPIRYLDSGSNVGYLNGLALGIRTAKDELPHLSWIICTNPDIQVDPQDFLSQLTLLPIRNVGLVGPAIRSTQSGTDQNPLLRVRPSLHSMRLRRWIFKKTLRAQLYIFAARLKKRLKNRNETVVRANNSTSEKVYAIHGSLFAISHGLFSQADFGWPCFLFGEELYLAELAAANGLDVLYMPDTLAIHQEHATTSSLEANAKFRWHHESYCFLIREFWLKP